MYPQPSYIYNTRSTTRACLLMQVSISNGYNVKFEVKFISK